MIQLLDRHDRDCEAFAARLGVPLHVVPVSLPETPFEVLPVLRSRLWAEVALWWPERRILVCADALGTVPYFRAGDEPAACIRSSGCGRRASLRGLERSTCSWGTARDCTVRAAAEAVEDALRTGRRRLPRWVVGIPRIGASALASAGCSARFLRAAASRAGRTHLPPPTLNGWGDDRGAHVTEASTDREIFVPIRSPIVSRRIGATLT